CALSPTADAAATPKAAAMSFMVPFLLDSRLMRRSCLPPRCRASAWRPRFRAFALRRQCPRTPALRPPRRYHDCLRLSRYDNRSFSNGGLLMRTLRLVVVVPLVFCLA